MQLIRVDVMQMYFDDLAIGQVERFGAYPVSREEVLDFAAKYDPRGYHLDEAAAADSVFGRVAASAAHTIAITARLMADRSKETGLCAEAGVGMNDMRIFKPVYPDDVLSLGTEIADMRPSQSRPESGVVSMWVRAYNQREEIVMQYLAILLFKRRAAAQPA